MGIIGKVSQAGAPVMVEHTDGTWRSYTPIVLMATRNSLGIPAGLEGEKKYLQENVKLSSAHYFEKVMMPPAADIKCKHNTVYYL